MRASLITMLVLAITGCATTSKYEAKVHTWETKDEKSLTQAWGKPDSIEKMSSGNHMLVYTRLKHPAVAYHPAQRNVASADAKAAPLANVYVRCATYFEVTPGGTIVSTLFRGDECKSRD